jgi:hypothetical protein
MTEDDAWMISLKRAGYALAKIADNQMSTWMTSTETAKEIIARQIMEAMNDMRKDLADGETTAEEERHKLEAQIDGIQDALRYVE